ncbi:MAG: efflux RND transporter periplasmic adaptor subunit [Myxococcales bacterium]|nr:efflux RND transporter periplasmic adaptor subunit [Myxococcales bacterium]
MRYVVAVGVLLVLITGLAGIKYRQISTLIQFGEAAQQAGPPPEAVGTAVAGKNAWQGALSAVGSVAAARGVTIANEVPGVVKAIRFESGARVKPGQVLVELDSSVEQAQLAAAQARLELATASAARTRKLVEGGAATQAQRESEDAQLNTAAADVAALRAQIAKKTVRAPFGGRLGIRQVNLGQYLTPGTSLTVLESLGSVYVDFTLPQQQAGDVEVGAVVNVTVAGAAPGEAPLSGKIAAIDPNLDDRTRSLRLRASLDNAQERLQPGMFVNVSVVMPDREPVVTVPATAIVHAPYGDSLFVVEDKKDDKGVAVKGPDGNPVKVARQQFVRVGSARGDFVAIEDGLTGGEVVVSLGAFKLHNGVPIVVNNDVKLDPSTSPRPANR